MPLANHFVAAVTFAPDMPSGKRYDIVPVLPQHGDTVEEVLAHFDGRGYLGSLFQAFDATDAAIIAGEALPHPADVTGLSYRDNKSLNVTHGALDLT